VIDDNERKEEELNQLFKLAMAGNILAMGAYLAITMPDRWKIPGSIMPAVFNYLKIKHLESIYREMSEHMEDYLLPSSD